MKFGQFGRAPYKIVTQYSMVPVEEIGCSDGLLGLRTST